MSLDGKKDLSSKPSFSKTLALGEFKKPLNRTSPDKTKPYSGAVTVEVKRRWTLTNTINTTSNKTGLSIEDFKSKANLIAKASKEAEDKKSVLTIQQPIPHKGTERVREESTPDIVQGKKEPKTEHRIHTPYDAELSKGIKIEERPADDGLRFKQGIRNRRDSKRIVVHKIDSDEEPLRKRSLASIRRSREKHKAKLALEQSPEREKLLKEVVIAEHITVGELASRMAEKSSDVIKALIGMGVMASINQTIDSDTAELVISEFGHQAKVIRGADVESVLSQDKQNTNFILFKRPPVVTVMGHIDHGKTSLLDAIRSTDVTAGEAGGITQHIGAYQVQTTKGEKITFIDTPGHQVFTSMRLRGAKVTDIVVLVVAAGDGVKDQTVESISHAKAAQVPIIVAINKMDKPGADTQRVTSELLSHDCIVESMGGDIMVIEVSALKKQNLDKLEEAILLQAELLELKTRTEGMARGVVIEAKVDKAKGVVATVLIQEGTLKIGDVIIAGTSLGRVRTMRGDKNNPLKSALPSMPVEITGLETAPDAGDMMHVLETGKHARDISHYRNRVLKKQKESEQALKVKSIEDLFNHQDAAKELRLIIKGDTHGSIEAIATSLMKLSTEKVTVTTLHKAVGGINESDVALAKTAKAIVLGFNVGIENKAQTLMQQTGVEIRNYSIIYSLIEDVTTLMEGKLSLIKKEQYLGKAEIRQVFSVSKIGKIAGAFVIDGIIRRNAKIKLLRDNMVIHQGVLKTLKRFKDDAREVASGYECGFTIDKYDDIKEGDVLESYIITEEKDTL